MYKGSQTYHINSVEPIEVFYNIRTDLDKLKYAVHINKIISDVTHENQNCYRILQLLLNTLYIIAETDKDLDLILGIFKIKLLCLLGFSPEVSKCTSCNNKENLKFFSIKDNGFKCETCSKLDTSCIKMSTSTKSALSYSVLAPSKKLYSFDIRGEALEEFKLITKLYFDEKLEKEYKIEDIF